MNIALSYHRFRKADREKTQTTTSQSHSLTFFQTPCLSVSWTSLCNKAREQQLPWLHPYMAGAAGSQTNTGFTWFLPAQTDKSTGISEKPYHTLLHRARLTPELHSSLIVCRWRAWPVCLIISYLSLSFIFSFAYAPYQCKYLYSMQVFFCPPNPISSGF